MGFIGYQYLSPLYSGKPYMGFNPNDASFTFTPGMDKRATSIFAASPIIQGKWDGTGTPDAVSFPRGNQLGNLTGFCYTNIDPYQGTISFWITPEWAGNDGKSHFLVSQESGGYSIVKLDDGQLKLQITATATLVQVACAFVAGTTYHVVGRWSTERTLDGTNYASLTVNNVHAYGRTTPWTIANAGSSVIQVGEYNSNNYPANALIQNLSIWRRVWTDSNGYGDDVGNGTGANSEISQVYAAGAGLDPCRVLGSWDCLFNLPTDSQVGALV